MAPASLRRIRTSNVFAGMLTAAVSITTVVAEVVTVVGTALVDSKCSDCVAGLMQHADAFVVLVCEKYL